MFKKSLCLATLAAGLLLPTFGRASTATDSADISITASVESYFEWASGYKASDSALTIDKDADWAGGTGTSASHIGKPGDVITTTKNLVVHTNTDPVFTIAPSNATSGILTEGGTNTTLQTSYKIVAGSAGTITASVAGYLPAETVGAGGAFDGGSTFTLTHDVSGLSDINLKVQASIPAGITLPKAATYSTTIKITATWS